ncbi:MAG: 30S ribosomal protein S24e [Candidatus Heimdallarchaeota archaeon]
MKIKILEKKNNKLLDRMEVSFQVDSEAETPRRLDVKAKLAALINHDDNLLIIKGIHQIRGMKKSKGIAHEYSSIEDLKRVEREYLINRNTPTKEEKKE